ncbi:MAG: nucleoside hydrolase [Alphaproteobacteria bacterium]|nr:nucleoside hydrolase [Alphaproteobacteria bacterium]
MTAKTPVIIDTDPGIDDAVALMLAMSDPSLDVIGITTVSGNVCVEKAEKNARKICQFAWHSGIPVYKGCDKPLKRSTIHAEWIHGEDGLSGLDFGHVDEYVESMHAVDYLINTFMSSPEHSISLVSLGPMTNIASAFLKEPKIISRIKELIIMGGCFNEECPKGNVTPYSEFNIYADPHAAEIVFDLGQRITIVPMEVGEQAYASIEFIEKLRDLNLRCATNCAELLARTGKILHEKEQEIKDAGLTKQSGTSLYDPCAIGYLIKPSLFSGNYGSVQVNTDSESEMFGMTTFIESTKRNCLVTYKINVEAFLNLVIEHYKLLS